MLDRLSNFIERHDADIGTVFGNLAHAVETTDWAAIGTGMERVGGAMKFVSENSTLMSRGFETIMGTALIRAIAGNTPVGRFLTAMLVGHEALATADPTDRTGSWIDRNVPGAAAVDDWFARHLGVGRTYEEQRSAQRTLDVERSRTEHRANRATGGWEYEAPSASKHNENLSAEARGLLDTVAGTESPGYDRLYGGGRFSDYSRHPNRPVPITSGPNAGSNSTAAGRYQFLYSTWLEAQRALNLPDFSPASQDRAAWWLAQRDYQARTGRDLSGDLRSNDPKIRAGIGSALRRTWTSLPGGIETTTNTNRFNRELEQNTVRQQRQTSEPQPDPIQPPPVAPTVQPRQTSDNNGASTVRIEIDHKNVPAGVSMRPSVTGKGAELASLRVRQAMPQAGGSSWAAS